MKITIEPGCGRKLHLAWNSTTIDGSVVVGHDTRRLSTCHDIANYVLLCLRKVTLTTSPQTRYLEKIPMQLSEGT